MRSGALVVAVLVWMVVPVHAGRRKSDPAAVAKLVSRANLLLGKNELAGALKLYRKADKISRHTCFVCYFEMATVWQREGELPQARSEADHALKAADGNKQAALAHMVRGVISSEMASGAKDKALRRAEADFRQAIQLDPTQSGSMFDLGVVLLREKRDAEGVAELTAYLARPGIDPNNAKLAREYVGDPNRAREPLLPDFSIALLDGGKITAASLAGKVVVLDFWGTWCPPCRAAVPMIADLQKRYATRPVEIIGVSSDENRNAWKAFVAKNHMDWPETIDLSGHMQQAFQVREFPTYIVADRQGVIRYRNAGYEDSSEVRLMSAINKALKEAHPAPGHAGQ